MSPHIVAIGIIASVALGIGLADLALHLVVLTELKGCRP